MLAKIWNYNDWISETNPYDLSNAFDLILKKAGFTILDTISYNFKPQGYTKLYLLCESHFAIHTFPEENKTYIELSSCNKKMYDKAINLIKENFHGERVMKGKSNGASKNTD